MLCRDAGILKLIASVMVYNPPGPHNFQKGGTSSFVVETNCHNLPGLESAFTASHQLLEAVTR